MGKWGRDENTKKGQVNIVMIPGVIASRLLMISLIISLSSSIIDKVSFKPDKILLRFPDICPL